MNSPLPARSCSRWSRNAETWQFVCLALLGAVLGLTAFRLFSGMTVVGMNGVDTFEYWKYADEFLHGKSDFDFDRLSFYAINVAAFKLLGVNDYAMRAFVAAFALVNIALVYLLGWLVARNAFVALAVAVLYAFNPTVLSNATTELPHIAGATFVLLAALFALPASDQSVPPHERLTAGFLLGAALACAVLTHEDLVFLIVGYVLAIALPAVLSETRSAQAGRDLALALASLVVGGIVCTAALMVALRVGPVKMADHFLHLRTHFNENTALRTGGDFFGYVTLRMLKNFTVDTVGGVITAVTVVLGVIVPARFVVRRCDRMRVLLTLELPVLMYVVCFLGLAQIYLEGPYRRLFVPLIGPTLVFAVCGSYLLSRTPQPLRRGIATAAVFAGVAYILIGFQPWTFASPPISPHRRLYDAVRDLITPERKLLLPACYADYRPWVGIGSRVYLDGNAVPIYQLRNWKSFDALIAAEHVGYVYVPGMQIPGPSYREWIEQLFRLTYGIPIDPALLNGLPQVSQEIWRGDTRVVWTDEACKFEAQVLRRLLHERGARLVETDPGEIYELPRPGTADSPARP